MLLTGAAGKVCSASALVALAASLSACSADVGRFDFSSVGSTPSSSRTASLPTPSEPVRRNVGAPTEQDQYATGPRPLPYDRTPAGGSYSPPPSHEAPVRMSGLPEAVSRETQAQPPLRSSPPPAPPRASLPASPPPAATARKAVPGETIEVQQGDTLYGISKRYRVSIAELMTLNGLQNPSIRPGQKITLPAGKRAVAHRNQAAPPSAATEEPVTPGSSPIRSAKAPAAAHAAPPVAPVAAAAPPASWTGTHTVAAGESLFGIARKHKVKAAELQSVNGIADPTKVRPGTVLKVPGGAAPAMAEAPAQPPVAAHGVAAGPGRPTTIINAPAAAAPAGETTKVAALGTNATDAAALPEPPKVSSAAKFRWPVKGKVIAGFGNRPDNTHNDGINISVPAGTEVLAAENGVVAYAGSELKGYGNLILVRHDGNWVSAYAHNDSLLVKRGDKVKRGQAIAKAGNTGTVDQPQVHFELRQGSKPIDPLPHMEKN